MICPNCGYESQGRFCPRCGSMLPAAENPARSYAPDPNPAPNQGYAPNQGPAQTQGYAPNQGYAQNQGYAPNAAPVNPGYVPSQNSAPAQGYYSAPQPGYAPAQAPDPNAETPARAALRSTARSGVFLAAVLFTTLSILLSLLQMILGLDESVAVVRSAGGFDASALVRNTSVVTMVVAAVIYGVLLIALWSIYFGAKSGNPLKTGGLTTVKVYYVVGLVLVCLGAAAVLIAIIIALSGDNLKELITGFEDAAAEYGVELPEELLGKLKDMVWLLIGLPVLMFFLAILYLAKVIQSINTAKWIILTGAPKAKFSGFVGVLSILVGVFGLISFVIGLVSTSSAAWRVLGAGNVLLRFLPSLFMALASFCFGMTLFRAKNGQRALLGQ